MPDSSVKSRASAESGTEKARERALLERQKQLQHVGWLTAGA